MADFRENSIAAFSRNRVALRLVNRYTVERMFGAVAIYVASAGRFRLSIRGCDARDVEFAIVPPYTYHSVVMPDGIINKILIEPETVNLGVLQSLFRSQQRLSVIERMRQGFVELTNVSASHLEIDDLIFGTKIESKPFDPRMAQIIENISANPGGRIAAKECAVTANVSLSHFMNLFHEATGTTFRGFRRWKQARSFMPLLDRPLNLADTAYYLGYADSAHFSRSIRKFYGIPPRSILQQTLDTDMVCRVASGF